MGCTPPVRTIQLRRQLVYSLGGTAPGPVDLVLTDDALQQIATLLDQVRVSVKLESSTNDLKCSAYYQLSADGETWGPMTNILPDIDGDGTYTGAWSSNANWNRAIRFGITAEQDNSVASREMGYVTAVLDLKLVG